MSVIPQAVFVGDDGIRAALTARRCDGQDGAHRQGLFDIFAAVEIPEVTLVHHACGNRLGGIDGAAAAHGQNEVHALPAADFNALVHQAASGVRLHAAQFQPCDAFGVQ